MERGLKLFRLQRNNIFVQLNEDKMEIVTWTIDLYRSWARDKNVTTIVLINFPTKNNK